MLGARLGGVKGNRVMLDLIPLILVSLLSVGPGAVVVGGMVVGLAKVER